MSQDSFFAINTLEQPWEERFHEKIGRALFRKNLYTDSITYLTEALNREGTV